EPATPETPDNGLLALQALADGTDDQGEGGWEPTSRSIVKARYRREYAKTDRHCNDDIAVTLREYLFDDEVLNFRRLVEFAKENDCWKDEYARLNPGQIRMNVGNRLRNRIKKGHQPIFHWGAAADGE